MTRRQTAVALLVGVLALTFLVARPRTQFLSIPRFLVGSGEFILLTNNTPPAGQEHSMPIPSGYCWRIMSANVALVSNATAANREVSLRIDNGSGSILFSPSRQNQIASLTRTYFWAIGQSTTTPVTQTSFTAPLPDHFYACSGTGFGTWNVQTLTVNLQGTDQFSSLNVWIERWRF